MEDYLLFQLEKSARIPKLIDCLYADMPVIEADRAVLLTQSYQQTEGLPIIKRRSAAFSHILKNIPITIRPDELIVGSNSVAPRGCQLFPEYSGDWVEQEYETFATREADPFYIAPETIEKLKKIYPYWKGKTTSELATSLMAPQALLAFQHNMFTTGNYFYNGVGHVCVQYDKVLRIGYEGIRAEAEAALAACAVGDADYAARHGFLEAVIESCDAVIDYARRYAALARTMAEHCSSLVRREELLRIAANCDRVPAKPARSFYEACQSFWFVQQLLQLESSGHSISPGRFDQYMYPYFKKDLDAGVLTIEQAQELIDCIWVKLNDLNKVRDAASAEGFAGYGLFQNLIAGGQDEDGLDATNELSYMTLEASMHVRLPQPSMSVRVWNGSPQSFLLKAAALTRTGLGVPAYYNDEVIIPALMNRGLNLREARSYCIIGCVEPQAPGRTDGWHDAAFFNMCRPLEMVFSDGQDAGVQIGPHTGDVTRMKTFDEFYDAYKKQSEYFIEMMVNSDNAIDAAHAARCPLPFESSMVDDCIARGKSVQEGGAHFNFTGPQGFGIANVADSLWAIRQLVFIDKKYSMADLKEAMEHNFGYPMQEKKAKALTRDIALALARDGGKLDEEDIRRVYEQVRRGDATDEQRAFWRTMRENIEALPKYGNDLREVDLFARDVAYTYTRPVEKYRNPRGGIYQAGLYPVSANVPLGFQTGATPDGRLANTPIADGVGPMSGRDTHGPTATANSVARLDHGIASNGTLFNQKFHPSALAGRQGLEKFCALIRSFFDQKGMHMQFNVVSRETLVDAQKNPEKYKTLVVRVAGYSALFTTLSRSLQDDIINRTEQH